MEAVVVRNIGGSRPRSKGSAIRIGAVNALYKVFAPIADFALDAGLSVRDIRSIFQITSVKLLADRQIEQGQRRNISVISARTGISRNEISRIIKMTAPMRLQASDREHPPTNRVLSAWCSNSEFVKTDGQPADLKIFGEGASFNLLVKKYGRGVPTRAILDELVRAGSIEIIAKNAVRLRAEVAVNGALQSNTVDDFGEQSADLLAAMLSNIRSSVGHRFLYKFKGTVPSERAVDAVRREISARTRQLTTISNGCLSKSNTRRHRHNSGEKSHSVNVTVIYCDEPNINARNTKKYPARRRNLRRNFS